jgi:L-serine dehydratase
MYAGAWLDRCRYQKDGEDGMNIFSMIGPVMIGPSSSHTAGACRLGRVVNKIADGVPIVEVTIQLSGSFARTYRGHGTDRALLAGIMGYSSSDEAIRSADKIAKKRGLVYSFVLEDIPNAHPNTAKISYRLANGKTGVVIGASIGGGNIRVDNIDGLRVSFSGESTTLMVLHRDQPGVIARVTNLMYWNYQDINIGNFQLSRRERGGQALMTMELDQVPPRTIISDLRQLEGVDNALLIRSV